MVLNTSSYTLNSTFTAIKVELLSCVKHQIMKYRFQGMSFINEFLQIRDDLSQLKQETPSFTAPYHSCSIPGLLQPILQFTQGFQVKIFLLFLLHQLLRPLPPVLTAPINTDISPRAQNLQAPRKLLLSGTPHQGMTTVTPGNKNYSAI